MLTETGAHIKCESCTSEDGLLPAVPLTLEDGGGYFVDVSSGQGTHGLLCKFFLRRPNDFFEFTF